MKRKAISILISVTLALSMWGSMPAAAAPEAACGGANTNMYRSAATGNWAVNTNWQVSTNGGATWAAAGCWPSSINGAIQIQNGHNITVTAAITVDQVIIDADARLIAAPVIRAASDAIITVQSAADDGTANAANCPGANCRLRDAIALAASGDTLNFAGDYTINLAGGELVINQNLTIDGTGHTIVINGPGASCTICFRVFNITGGSVTLNRLNINNGTATGNFGGGILNASTLTVMNSTFSGNSAPWGGAIENSGTLDVTNSSFTANTAANGGAGLENVGGIVRITNSTFANNIADNGIVYGSGGGLQLEGGTLDLVNVTVANNQAKGAADDGGGGVMIYFGTATITNSTIAGNTTASPTGGAGVSLYYASATLRLYNSIVDQSGVDCTRIGGGTLTADSHNLASDGTCDNASTSTSINLGPLANNGGSTQTLALLPASPAIDVGDPATCAAAPVNSLDQRGQPRNDLQCDLGAFELEYADSNTVQRAASSTTLTTFGPTLMGMQRDAGSTDPGVLAVTKYGGSTHGAGTISAEWVITPTTTSGFSLTLKLCYTLSELGSLTESSLRFWRFNGSTWVQDSGTPTLSTVGGNHCAQISGITELGAWTLATTGPTAITLSTFSASAATPMWPLAIGLALLATMLILFSKRRLQRRN